MSKNYLSLRSLMQNCFSVVFFFLVCLGETNTFYICIVSSSCALLRFVFINSSFLATYHFPRSCAVKICKEDIYEKLSKQKSCKDNPLSTEITQVYR